MVSSHYFAVSGICDGGRVINVWLVHYMSGLMGGMSWTYIGGSNTRLKRDRELEKLLRKQKAEA